MRTASLRRIGAQIDRRARLLGRGQVWSLCSLLWALAFWLDYVTGAEVRLMIAYLVPTGVAFWYLGPAAGMVFMIATVAARFYVSATAPQYRFVYEATDAVLNGALLIVYALLVALVKAYVTEARQRADDLESTVRSRTEQLLGTKRAAEAANLAKSAFLASMSHEIRTPLNAVIGLTHLIRGDGLTPSQSERMDQLEGAGRHLLQLLNAVLDLSKIESGRHERVEVPVAIDAIVNAVFSIARQGVDPARVNLTAEHDALPRHLLGDPLRLQEALLNLVTNAVKFTPQGGVRVRTTVEAEDSDSLRLRFDVSDTGIGVAPDALARLFRPFEQADNTLARRHGGTGLGLVITKRIAQLMGGDAGAHSRPGEGSTFWFSARLKKTGAHGAAAGGQVRADRVVMLRQSWAGTRVLLVEDEPVNREITSQMLANAGLAVDVAPDGARAVSMASAGDYALILMDLQMPMMDGFEAARRIRRLPGKAQPNIIALTASAFNEDRALCIAAGMNEFLAKPVDPAVLYETLWKWLSADSLAGSRAKL